MIESPFFHVPSKMQNKPISCIDSLYIAEKWLGIPRKILFGNTYPPVNLNSSRTGKSPCYPCLIAKSTISMAIFAASIQLRSHHQLRCAPVSQSPRQMAAQGNADALLDRDLPAGGRSWKILLFNGWWYRGTPILGNLHIYIYMFVWK